MDATLLTFCGLSAAGLTAALLMVTRRNLVHAALYLVAVFVVVAAMFVLFRAEFLAAVQVLVYAGGILVLYLFVILLVDLREEEGARPPRRSVHTFASAGLVLSTVVLMGFHALARPGSPAAANMTVSEEGNLESLGTALFRYYLIPFEAVSVLLLVAMVGAIVLARSDGAKPGRSE